VQIPYPTLRSAAPTLIPVAALGGLLVMATALLPRLAPEMQRAFATGLALDFTILLPALVYLCLVRTKRAPLICVVPAFIVGLAVATITTGAHAPRVIDALHLAALPIEIGVVAFLIVTARRLAKATGDADGDFATRFRAAARQTLGARIPADVLTTEVATLRYAFGPSVLPDGGFTVHRRTASATLVVGLGLAVVIETAVVHLLVSRWNEPAAWVLTALSLYAIIWLLGDFRAMGARPTVVTSDTLRLRIGLRWEADIPLAMIESAEPARHEMGGPKDKSELVAPVAGQTNIRIRFREAQAITGSYAMRRTVSSVITHVDDAGEFRDRLTAVRSR